MTRHYLDHASTLPVLEAMGVDAQRSLRLSVGWNTTDADLDAVLDAAPGILGDLRALPSWSATGRQATPTAGRVTTSTDRWMHVASSRPAG